MPLTCLHCDDKECITHCQESMTGKHKPDPESAHSSSSAFFVEFECVYCRHTGAIEIDPDDITWG